MTKSVEKSKDSGSVSFKGTKDAERVVDEMNTKKHNGKWKTILCSLNFIKNCNRRQSSSAGLNTEAE